MRADQADLMREAAEALEDLGGDETLIADLREEADLYWAELEPTDVEIYRARGGVLKGEL